MWRRVDTCERVRLMEVVVASHPSALEHDTGARHPERPDRVLAVQRGIDDSGLRRIDIESPAISRSDLALVHDPEYVEVIEVFCSVGGGALDRDTIASNRTWTAAITAAGGVKAAVDALDDLENATAFVAARPPGHHALSNHAMGFCLFNNVAITAAVLRRRGLKVAILDWDVHHGNGTQAMVGEEPHILYVSTHQSPFYPYEGEVSDIDSPAVGTTVNIPLPAGTAGDVVRRAWGEIVIPVVTKFDPDWILVSAGYDGHVADSLADFRLLAGDYGWIAEELSHVHPPNRIVTVLEGGYDLDALRDSTKETLAGYAGAKISEEALHSPPESGPALELARSAIARHWDI
jgi:acetoin utilization deacetylase AcuC-like enzyme